MHKPVLLIMTIRLQQKEQSQDFMDAWTAVSEILKREEGFVKHELRRDGVGTTGFDFVSFFWWQNEADCNLAMQKHSGVLEKLWNFSRFGSQSGVFHWVGGTEEFDSDFDGMS